MSGESQVIICSNCGARLRPNPKSTRATIHCACGQDMPVAPVGHAPAPSAAISEMAQRYAGRIPHRRYAQEPAETRRSWPQIIIGAVVLIVAAVMVMWYASRPTHGLPGPLAGDDQKILDYVEDHASMEIREWLEGNPNRIISGFTKSQGNYFVDKVYGMGAKQVLAFGAYMTVAVVVELPEDPEQRKALFEWSREYASLAGPAASDVGQRYLFVRLGL